MSDSSSSSCSERTETDADNAGKPTSPGASTSSVLESSADECTKVGAFAFGCFQYVTFFFSC